MRKNMNVVVLLSRWWSRSCWPPLSRYSSLISRVLTGIFLAGCSWGDQFSSSLLSIKWHVIFCSPFNSSLLCAICILFKVQRNWFPCSYSLCIFLKIVMLFCPSTLISTKPKSNSLYVYTYVTNKDDPDSLLTDFFRISARLQSVQHVRPAE